VPAQPGVKVVTFHYDREVYEPQVGSPRKAVVLAVSAILGLGLGFALAVVRTLFNNIRSTQLLERNLSRPVEFKSPA